MVNWANVAGPQEQLDRDWDTPFQCSTNQQKRTTTKHGLSHGVIPKGVSETVVPPETPLGRLSLIGVLGGVDEVLPVGSTRIFGGGLAQPPGLGCLKSWM